jgi:hypothetical protein
MTLKSWRIDTGNDGPLVYADKRMALDVAIKTIVDNRLYRLPIIQEQENLVLGMVNIEDLFQFFFDNFIGEEELYEQAFCEIEMGTYHEDMTLCPTSYSIK